MIYLKRFPNDRVIIGDAYEYTLWNYDKYEFIWASPPCQSHSWTNHFLHEQNVRRYPDFRLYELITYLLLNANKKGIKFVVENVKPQYDEYLKDFLIKPSFILGRHYYWGNLAIPNEGFKYSKENLLNSKKTTRRSNEQYFKELCHHYNVDSELLEILNISNYRNHDMKCQLLRNCVPPQDGKMILDQAIYKKQKILTTFI